MDPGAVREAKDYLPGTDKLVANRVVAIGTFPSCLSLAEWSTIARRLRTNWSVLIVDFCLVFGVVCCFVGVEPPVPVVPSEVLLGVQFELDVEPVI